MTQGRPSGLPRQAQVRPLARGLRQCRDAELRPALTGRMVGRPRGSCYSGLLTILPTRTNRNSEFQRRCDPDARRLEHFLAVPLPSVTLVHRVGHLTGQKRRRWMGLRCGRSRVTSLPGCLRSRTTTWPHSRPTAYVLGLWGCQSRALGTLGQWPAHWRAPSVRRKNAWTT